MGENSHDSTSTVGKRISPLTSVERKHEERGGTGKRSSPNKIKESVKRRVKAQFPPKRRGKEKKLTRGSWATNFNGGGVIERKKAKSTKDGSASLFHVTREDLEQVKSLKVQGEFRNSEVVRQKDGNGRWVPSLTEERSQTRDIIKRGLGSSTQNRSMVGRSPFAAALLNAMF